MQRCVGVVGRDCEHEMRRHKSVEGLLPRNVQRLLEMQQTCTSHECVPLMSADEKSTDVVQDVDAA